MSSNNKAIGVGFDSKGRPNRFVELSSIDVDSLSVSSISSTGDSLVVLGGLSATAVSAASFEGITLGVINDVNDLAPLSGQVLTWNSALELWEPDTNPAGVTDHLLLSNIGTNNHTAIDNHIGSSTIHFTEASIDHGSIAGLGDDDHPQYVLSSTNNALSSLVTNIETSTVDISGYINANEGAWNSGGADLTSYAHLSGATFSGPGTVTFNTEVSGVNISSLEDYSGDPLTGQVMTYGGSSWEPSTSPAGVTDHVLLSNIGSNTHALIDTHIGSSTIHFTEGSIDHTNITNVGTNSHALIDTHIGSSTIHFTEGSIDHGSIAGLGDDDHPQYVLSATNNNLSSLVTSIETSTIDISGYINTNEASWNTDTTDHTALSNIGTNDHDAIDSHIGSATIHFTEAAIDHGSIAGLGDDDHPQYVLSSTNDALSSAYLATSASVNVLDDLIDGVCIDTIGVSVVANGTSSVIVLSNADNPSNDLTFRFQASSFTLDTTPALSAQLNAGTDISPVHNYAYVTRSGSSLTLMASGSDWPNEEYASIATVVAQSDASMQTDGPYKVHAWTDHINTDQREGHLAHINAKLRQNAADWNTGVTPEDLQIDDPNAYIETTSGVVYQLHPHNFPAFVTSDSGSFFVVNDPDAAYSKQFSLSGLTKLSTGASITINRYVNFVLWGVASENGEDCKLMLNLPDDEYNTEADAQTDSALTASYSIPEIYKGCGFLIARYTVQKTVGGWVQSQKTDLRGLKPSTSPGGGASLTDHGILTGLSDNDHPQYTLSATNNALSSLVTSIETSTIDISGYINANEGTWSAGGGDLSSLDDVSGTPLANQVLTYNNAVGFWEPSTSPAGVTDHILLSNIGSNSHDLIDTHIGSSTIHFTEGSIDHINIASIGSNTHALIDTHIGSSTIHFTEGSIDHGSIAGLSDNDHPQYVLSATNNNLSSLVTSIETSTIDISGYINANEGAWSAGGGDLSSLDDVSGVPLAGQVLTYNNAVGFWEPSTSPAGVTDHVLLSNIGTNTHALVDSHIGSGAIHFTEGSIDHGSIAGLSDNDHPQYVLSSTNNVLSSLVSNIEVSTIDISGYININEGAWSTDTTDHTALSNIGSNSHDLIDTHIGSSTIHFTEGSIDHTNITNVGTNTHALIDSHIGSGAIHFTEGSINHINITNVGSNSHALVDSHIGSGAIHFTEGSIDHGNIAGLGDNDHPQYVLSATNNVLSSLVTSIETSTIDISGYINTNEGAWSAGGDHTLLSNIGTNTHALIDSHIGSSTIHFTEGSIDHTNITNVGTNTHALVDSHIGSSTIHFTEGSIDHTNIASIGSNTHALIDTHIGSSTIHFTEGSIDHTNIASIGSNTHALIDTHIGSSTIHFTEGSIDHTNIASIGSNTHALIDTHIGSSTIHFTEGSIDHNNITNVGTNTHALIDTHIGSSTIHFTEGSIDHTNIASIGSNTHALIDTHIGSGAIHDDTISKGVTILEPTSTEDITIFRAEKAITVQSLNVVVRGSTPSITFTVRYGSDRSAAGTPIVTAGSTTTSTTGEAITSLNNTAISDNDFVWLEITTSSGTVDEYHLTIHGTIT